MEIVRLKLENGGEYGYSDPMTTLGFKEREFYL